LKQAFTGMVTSVTMFSINNSHAASATIATNAPPHKSHFNVFLAARFMLLPILSIGMIGRGNNARNKPAR
jgi:hypothetical protein